MNKNRFLDYQEELLKSLQNPEMAYEYLNAALADDDPRIFLVALKNVLDARKSRMAAIARKTKLNRENLYRMLSKRGNPKLSSIQSVLGAVGMNLFVGPTPEPRHKHR